jgi:hypothetical protein
MPEPRLFDTVSILRELRDDLDAAYAARESQQRERRSVGPWRRRLRLAAVAGVAAAAVAIVAALPAGEKGTTAILEAAAATAAAQPATAPAPGAYAYFKETGESGVKTTLKGLDDSGGRTTLEWWVARDGSGRVLQTMRIGNDFERPADDPRLPRWKRAGEAWVRDIRFDRGEFAEVHGRVAAAAVNVDVLSLPTEPAALESALRRELRAAATDSDPETGFAGGPKPADWQMLTVIEQALAHPLASPQQRSALYRVAARLDGVEAIEDVQDPIGRPATVLRLLRQTHPGTVRTEVYFDPGTSATLARRIVTSEGGSTVIDSRVSTPPTTVHALTRP